MITKGCTILIPVHPFLFTSSSDLIFDGSMRPTGNCKPEHHQSRTASQRKDFDERIFFLRFYDYFCPISHCFRHIAKNYPKRKVKATEELPNDHEKATMTVLRN